MLHASEKQAVDLRESMCVTRSRTPAAQGNSYYARIQLPVGLFAVSTGHTEGLAVDSIEGYILLIMNLQYLLALLGKRMHSSIHWNSAIKAS